MRRRLVLALVMALFSCSGPPRPKDAAIRGVALGLFASEPGYDYGGLLREIADLGATDVLLVVQWHQRDLGSDDLSPGTVDLARSMQQARVLGLRVAIMPLVQLREGAYPEWRGQLRPRGGAAQWFTCYRTLLLELARTAQQGGAVRLGIGSELATLEPYQEEWRQTVREVRRVFAGPRSGGGRLFYSLNWDTVSAQAPLPAFLDDLDEIGVAAYFALAGPSTRSDRLDRQQLAHAWEGPRAQLQALRRRFPGTPVFFSEVGYPSLGSAAASPWNPDTDAAIDVQLQRDLMELFCQQHSGKGELAGFFAWNWFGFGGPTDRGYTPRGKPAAAALAQCLRSWR